MMTEPLTITKLIILYMLYKAENPLLKSKVFGFIIDNDYTNYFSLLQACGELVDAGFIESRIIMNGAHIALLDEGLNALELFSSRLPQTIRDEIKQYLKSSGIDLKSSRNINTNYYKSGPSDYVSELSLREDGTELLMLKISVPTEAGAKAMCENFEEKSNDLYAIIVDKLLQ